MILKVLPAFQATEADAVKEGCKVGWWHFKTVETMDNGSVREYMRYSWPTKEECDKFRARFATNNRAELVEAQ